MCTCICMYTGVCMRILVYVCIVCAPLFVCMCGCVSSCVRLRVAANGPFTWDPDSLQETRICVRCGPNTIMIRRQTDGVIWRSVPVHAVNIRLRFRSKTASFYVSVCFYIISLFTIINRYLCFTRTHFMWPSDIFYQYDYLYHFMRYQWAFTYLCCWSEHLSASFHVLPWIVTRFDLLIGWPSL